MQLMVSFWTELETKQTRSGQNEVLVSWLSGEALGILEKSPDARSFIFRINLAENAGFPWILG